MDFENIKGFAYKRGCGQTGMEHIAILHTEYLYRSFNKPEDVPEDFIPASILIFRMY